MGIGSLFDLIQQATEVLAPGTVTTAELQAELAEEFTQRFQLFRLGSFVDTIQRRNFVFEQKTGGGDVGDDHALFDQLVRIVAHQRHDLFDLALLAEHDTGLGGFEIDRPALRTTFAQ